MPPRFRNPMDTLRRIPHRPPIARLEYLAYARDLEDAPTCPLPLEGFSFRDAATQDAPRLADAMRGPGFHGPPMSLAEIHELHRQGHVCFIAEHEGEIVYLSWMQFGTASFPSIKMHLVLREDEVYLGAVFVSPAFRRRGLGRAAADERARWLRSRGIRTLYGLVLTHNVPMRRMVEGIGARQVGRAVLICWRWGRWIPLISVVTSFDRSASLGEICAPDRLRLRTGLTFYRKGPGRVYNS